MNQVIENLKGKKTYVIALAIGLVTAAEFLGWIDMATAATLYGLLGAGGLVTLRMAVNS